MSALCLLEIDRSLAQDRLDSEPSTPSDKSAEPQAPQSSAEPEHPPISELELLKEEESVSISARYEQPISEAASNVYVITDDDIRHSGAIDLPTILRRIPGIEVIQMTGADFDVSARGDNQARANKMLVLIDGRSFYLDVQGEVLWKMLPISLPEIRRIEVLKGPASALYGFNAFDGVINIITKRGSEMKGTLLQFGGGEFGTITTSAVHGGQTGKLDYRISAGEDQTNKWRNRDSLAFRAYRFNTDTQYALSSTSRFLLSGGLAYSNNYDGPNVDTVTVFQKPVHNYINAGYERPNFFIRAFWNRWDQDSSILANPLISNFIRFRSPSSNNPDANLTWDSYNVEAQHALELGSSNRFTYGFNYRHNAATSNFLTQFTREDRFGIYVQDEWHLTKKLTAVGGVRYDLDTFINPTFSPRVSLIFKPHPDHSFRAEFAQAYRPPTIFETNTVSQSVTTIPGVPFPLNANLQGSQNLTPEKITSFDIGYQGWYLKHRLRLRADLFFNHISDLIGQFQITPAAPPFLPPGFFTFQNRGQADIYGGEAGLEFWATDWLSGFANFSYEEIGQTIPSSTTLRRAAPRYKANAGLRGEWDNGLSGEASLYHVGAATYPVATGFTAFQSLPGGQPAPFSRVGSYNLLNLRGAYKLWQQKAAAGYMREAEVAVTAFNALNDRHKEHPLGDTIGSRVMGWLTLRF
jgi:iron complex outermembrane receptor protein